jgi:two-component system response regulator
MNSESDFDSGGTLKNQFSPEKTVVILLVEDDPADVQLVQEGLSDTSVPVDLNVVNDGVEALAYLRGQGQYIGALIPDLILLDLKMPKKSGLEVLAELKSDDQLRQVPVIVLTTSDSPEDILKAYQLQASCVVTKPADLDDFHRTMNSIKDFCLTVVKLPPRLEEVARTDQ